MESGLGEAIGLQERPNLFANVASATLAREDAKERAAAEALRKKREAEDASNKKLFSEADVFFRNSKFHNYVAGAARADFADTLNKAFEIRDQNPNDSYAGVHNEMMGLMARMNQYKNTSDYLSGLEKVAQEGKALVDPEFIKNINKEDFSKDVYRDENGFMVSKKWLSTLPNDRYGVSGDGKGRFGGTPIPIYNLQKTIEDFKTNPNNWTEGEQVFEKVKGVPGVYAKKTKAEINPVMRESFIQQMRTDPNLVRYWGAINGDKIKETDPNKYSQAVQDDLVNFLRTNASGSKMILDNITANPPAERKESVSKGLSLDATFDQVAPAEVETIESSSPLRTKIEEQISGVEGQVADLEAKEARTAQEDAALNNARLSLDKLNKQYESFGERKAEIRYSIPVTLKTVNQPTVVNMGEGVIDLNTNTQARGANSYKFVPRKIGMLKVKGKWTPYVFGESYDKAAKVDADGNIASDQNVSADLAVPLSKVEGFLNQQGTPTKWTKEALSKLQGGTSTSAAEKETNSEEVQEFTVNGKKYRVPANEVEAFKKDMGL